MEGFIYKITNNVNDECYIGSTTKKLNSRFSNHKSAYLKRGNGGRGNCTSFDLFDKYGLDNCKIELIEAVNVNDVKELRRLEGNHQINANNCINKCTAGLTRQESQAIYHKHSEVYKEYQKEYRKKIAGFVFPCDCGKQYNKLNKYSHFKSKYHIENVNKKV
jgi:hypothetical protein